MNVYSKPLHSIGLAFIVRTTKVGKDPIYLLHKHQFYCWILRIFFSEVVKQSSTLDVLPLLLERNVDEGEKVFNFIY